MAILFFVKGIKYPIKDKRKIKAWIKEVIEQEKKTQGDINIILSDDSHLLEVNKEYLKRDYYTDIITFDYCVGNVISGDLFISIDRIKENARKYKVEDKTELYRVIIHGILHLAGYNDQKKKESEVMKRAEDKYLENFLIE